MIYGRKISRIQILTGLFHNADYIRQADACVNKKLEGAHVNVTERLKNPNAQFLLELLLLLFTYVVIY